MYDNKFFTPDEYGKSQTTQDIDFNMGIINP